MLNVVNIDGSGRYKFDYNAEIRFAKEMASRPSFEDSPSLS
jgi:hypothetical protein